MNKTEITSETKIKTMVLSKAEDYDKDISSINHKIDSVLGNEEPTMRQYHYTSKLTGDVNYCSALTRNEYVDLKEIGGYVVLVYREITKITTCVVVNKNKIKE